MSESWVDVVSCTLPTAEQPMRLAEFDALFATSLVRVERLSATEARLTLAGARDLTSRVQDLANRESDCCSFFTFTVTQRDRADGESDVELTVAVSDDYTHVLEALAARADALTSTS